MIQEIGTTNKYVSFLQITIIIAGIYLSSFYSYILFHSLAELFCVAIAFGCFIVAWNTRKFMDSNYLFFIGVAYFFVGVMDLLHTLAYKGLGIFPDDPNLATQLWIGARYMASASFFIAPFLIGRKIKGVAIFFPYLALTALLITSIFYWHNFPDAFIAGSGLTDFKINSEYAIIALLAASMALIYLKRKEFNQRVYVIMNGVLATTIASELFFTLYVGVYDSFNLLGHLFKVLSFYLLYLAFLEFGLIKPYGLIFKNLKDKEVALKRSEERYRLMVEFSPDAIAVHQDKIIKFVNESGVHLFGAHSKEQLLGKNIIGFIHDEHKAIATDRIQRLESGESVPLREFKIVRSDGSIIEAEVKSRLVKYEDGEMAVESIFRDTTKQKETERKLMRYSAKMEELAINFNKFRLAVEYASEHITITDNTGVIIYVNQSAEKETGFLKTEMVGMTPALWILSLEEKFNKNKMAFNEMWSAIKNKTSRYYGEARNRKKNGKEYISDIHISPVLDEKGAVAFFIFIERDITKLKEIDRAKTEFVSLASHQLRTPLSSISLVSELLLRGITGDTDEKTKGYLQEIYNSTQRMAELIESLLNISRIELGTFTIKPEPISLPESMDQMLDEMRLLIANKGIVLAKDFDSGLPVINFDRNILRMAVENLITNAVRYTPKNGKIRVEVVKQDAAVLINVIDNGCGIPDKDKDKIFGKLYRADNAKEIAPEGAGLGLYIVKSVLEKSGANIWFDSKVGKGTTFSVLIPLEKKYTI